MPPSTREHAAAITREHTASARALFNSLDDLSSFRPPPSDIFIVSFMKSGTTLMQQMLYQLLVATRRVPSDPTGENFSDISEVVPFVEARFVTGVSESPNAYTPRVWKSHSDAGIFRHMLAGEEGGPRFIYCFREGREVIRSYADFAVDWLAKEPVEGDELRAEVYRQLFLSCFLGREDGQGGLEQGEGLYDWFGHVSGWLESESRHVLYVHFDDLIKDLGGWVARVARYVGVEVDQEQVDWVVAKCDRLRMAADVRFRDGMVAKLMGWRPDLGLRVRSADDVGFRRFKLPSECEVEYGKRFRHVFGDVEWGDLVRRAEVRNEEAGV